MDLACGEVKGLILDLIRGEIDAGSEAAARLHLRHCASCKASLDRTVMLLDAVRSGTEIKVSGGFASKVLARVEALEGDSSSDRLAALIAQPTRNFGDKAAILSAFARHRLRIAPVWAAAIAVHAAAIMVLACMYIPFQARQHMVPFNAVISKDYPAPEDGELPPGVEGEGEIPGGTHWNIEPVNPPVVPEKTDFPNPGGSVDSAAGSQAPVTEFFPKKFNPGIGMVSAWFGCRTDPVRKAKALERNGGADMSDCLSKTLEFLAARQESDGGFAIDDPSAGAAYRTGVTGLALLAFLGDGHSRVEGRFKNRVAAGISFLLDGQDGETGLIGPNDGHYMYNHGIALSAILECMGLEKAQKGQVPADLKEAAALGVAFLLRAQNETGGFGYTRFEKAGDASVTVWQAHALALAACLRPCDDMTGVDKAIKSVRKWLKSSTDEKGHVGYRGRGNLKTYPESMTAVGLYMNAVLLGSRGFVARRQAELVSRKPPAPGKPADFYFWYYASSGLSKADSSRFAEWNSSLKAVLKSSQAEDGGFSRTCAYGDIGGRVFATAMAALAMEVYFRLG